MACSIEVPVAWFEAGATLQIQLPRLLQCARCEGGGCDACGRRGAFEQQAAGIVSQVEIVLPKQPADSCAPVKLRLPSLGARAPEPPGGERLAGASGAEPAVVSAPEPVSSAEPAVVSAPERASVIDAPSAAPLAARSAQPVAGETVSALAVVSAPLALLPAPVSARPPARPLALALAPAQGANVTSNGEPQGAATAPGGKAAPASGKAAPASGKAAPASAETAPASAETAPGGEAALAPVRLPPGHLLLTVIPRVPAPGWAPPSNMQALVLAPPPRSFWEWLRPLELLLFPDRLLAALRARSGAVWLWAALAVVLLVLGFWLLTRSGSRSQ